MNAFTFPCAVPANASKKLRAKATAGLEKDIDEVNH
jgi:hypothetical protein